MHAPPIIRVAPVTAVMRPALLQLRVSAAQCDFVGGIEASLADAACCHSSTPMAILRGETPVGYYRLEANASVVTDRDFDHPALGLRSFFIDHRWQRQGLATQALHALIADLATRHPEARLLVLLVHCHNLTALRLYLRAGFIDIGQLYHGDQSEPQRLLRRDLP